MTSVNSSNSNCNTSIAPRSLKIQAQRRIKQVGVNTDGDSEESSLEHGTAEMYDGKAIS